MPDTYTLIEKVTVGATVSSITFTSIPQTYTDLKIVGSVRTTAGSTYGVVYIYPNGSASNQTARRIYFDYATLGTDNTVTGGLVTGAGGTANTFGRFELDIPNYTNTSYYKSIGSFSAGESNTNTGIYGQLSSNLWSSTSALTSIEIVAAATQYSTFYLYGIAKSGVTPTSAPKATGGDTIVTDGTYWYHAFLSSSSFTPKQSLSCDVLVVAGGASGGCAAPSGVAGGGGGAGGVVYSTTQSFANATNYTVTVGAGGAGKTYNSGSHQRGTSGNNSNVTGGALSLTAAVGGGAGGVYPNDASRQPLTGGSGGGGGADSGVGYAGAAGTSGQGNAGGSGFNGTPTGPDRGNGGGGGGSGAVGGTGTSTAAGAGGAGINTYSSWLTATGNGVSGYIAGGGGAGSTYSNTAFGAGGSGGGGAGGYGTASALSNASNGTANTGSGGGGTAAYNSAVGGGNSGSGGSGIVIVRYAV